MTYGINDVTLPQARGFPLQTVAKGNYGYKWAKWITKKEAADNDIMGYWESRSYSKSADRIRPGLRPLTGDMEPAQKHFQMVLDMPAAEQLRGLARNGLREIAMRGLKARGPRMYAVFYSAEPCSFSAGSRQRRSGRSPLRSVC